MIGFRNIISMVVRARCRMPQYGPLIGAQYVHLALVDRLPVVLQDATGISLVWIPRPVGIANVIRFQEIHQGALPNALGIPTHRAPSELSHEYRGSPTGLHIGPMLLPDVRQSVSEVRRIFGLETRLPGDLRPDVMTCVH